MIPSLSYRVCGEDRLLAKKQNVAAAVVKINFFFSLYPSCVKFSVSLLLFLLLLLLCLILHLLSFLLLPLLFLRLSFCLSLFLGLLLIMHAYTPLIVQVVYAVSTISRFESRGSFENTTVAALRVAFSCRDKETGNSRRIEQNREIGVSRVERLEGSLKW